MRTLRNSLAAVRGRRGGGGPAATREPPPHPHQVNPALGASKVIGLGAPLCVGLHLQACEVPLLRSGVLAEISKHERRRPGQPTRPTSTSEEWANEQRILDGMLEGLGPDDDGPIEVLWPTAYAYDLLRRALDEAVVALRSQMTEPEALPELANALGAASACLATWRAFQAVDNGGLDDVRL